MIHILLYRQGGIDPISALIRWRTWGQWSHAAIMIDDVVYESTARDGVHAHSIADSIAHAHRAVDVFAWPWAGPDDVARAKAEAEKIVAEKARYDFGAILSFVTRAGGGNAKRFFCSELVAHLMRCAGARICCRRDDTISPADIGASPLRGIYAYTLSAAKRDAPQKIIDPELCAESAENFATLQKIREAI